MAEICVVHLVRAKNGIQPFRNFLESYLKYDSGVDHELLIIFKGFIGTNGTGKYTQLLNDISFKAIHMNDFGFDIRSFFLAVNKVNKKHFCFLNSFSTIRGHEWLSKLNGHLRQNGIGLVGATGSYESHYSNFLIAQKGIGCAQERLARRLFHFFAKMKYKSYFDPFPNYHIRTNGFMISRDLMRQIHPGIILSKMAAHRFESGKRGLTKQVLQMNLGVRVVGKNGEAYRIEDWCTSDTFRQGDQNNLLIADNQTNAYLHADAELKRRLSGCAWGKGIHEPSRKA